MPSMQSFLCRALLAIIVAYGVALCIGWPQSGTRANCRTRCTISGASGRRKYCGAAVLDRRYHSCCCWRASLCLPLIPHTSHWWESNLNRFKVAGGLALVTMAYYAFLHGGSLEGHWPSHHVVAPAESGVQTELVNTILANAMLQEFVPFIVLLFSLYTISGGIRIAGRS